MIYGIVLFLETLYYSILNVNKYSINGTPRIVFRETQGICTVIL